MVESRATTCGRSKPARTIRARRHVRAPPGRRARRRSTLGRSSRSCRRSRCGTADDPGAELRERSYEARRLRVVDDHDVASSDRTADECAVGRERLLVDRALFLAELSAVAWRAVETIVDPLCHGEELAVALDDDPLGFETDPTHVAEQRREHLRDAAAGGCRVHVDDASSPEERAESRRGLEERVDPGLSNERLEPARVDWARVALGGSGHRAAVSRIACLTADDQRGQTSGPRSTATTSAGITRARNQRAGRSRTRPRRSAMLP